MRTLNLNSSIVWVAAPLAAVSLSGCLDTSERSQSNSERTQIVERHPTPDGGYVEKTTEYIAGNKTSQTVTNTDISAGSIGGSILTGATTGNWAAFGSVVLTALGGTALTLMQRARANEHKEDAAEGWAKYEQAMKDKPNA